LPDGLKVYLVMCAELYDRPGSPYADREGHAFDDNDVRFARLSLAAAELAELGVGGWRPDVTHLNDWPGALTAGYLRWRGARAKTVLTIHNLAHQGLFEPSRLDALAIPGDAFTLEGVEFHGRISFLKAGLNYADEITTVSETYATEIGSPEFGCGLDGLIAKRRAEGRLTGILNGIDKSWDPRADKRCPYLLDAQRWKGRYADFIRGAFGLSLARAPLFAFIARLAHQKGIDLVIAAAEPIVARGAQLVIIGRGEPEDERAVIELAERFPDAVGARVGFDAREARAVFAGADFLLMPSRFEPCGLSQMFAQRFGALPIAHRTGGLAETVEHLVTGVLFDDATTSSLEEAIDKAFDIYAAPRELQAMRRAAMAKSFDWEQSAARYAALYRRLAAV
jgi:starch synthase